MCTRIFRLFGLVSEISSRCWTEYLEVTGQCPVAGLGGKGEETSKFINKPKVIIFPRDFLLNEKEKNFGQPQVKQKARYNENLSFCPVCGLISMFGSFSHHNYYSTHFTSDMELTLYRITFLRRCILL